MYQRKKGREEGTRHAGHFHRCVSLTHLSNWAAASARAWYAPSTCPSHPFQPLSSSANSPLRPSGWSYAHQAMHLSGPHPSLPYPSLPWTCLPPRRATTTSSHPDGCPCHPTMLTSKCESHRKPHTSHLLLALSDRAYIEGEKNFPNLKKLNFTSYFHALEHTYKLSLRALPVILLGTSFTALPG